MEQLLQQLMKLYTLLVDILICPLEEMHYGHVEEQKEDVSHGVSLDTGVKRNHHLPEVAIRDGNMEESYGCLEVQDVHQRVI